MSNTSRHSLEDQGLNPAWDIQQDPLVIINTLVPRVSADVFSKCSHKAMLQSSLEMGQNMGTGEEPSIYIRVINADRR